MDIYTNSETGDRRCFINSFCIKEFLDKDQITGKNYWLNLTKKRIDDVHSEEPLIEFSENDFKSFVGKIKNFYKIDRQIQVETLYKNDYFYYCWKCDRKVLTNSPYDYQKFCPECLQKIIEEKELLTLGELSEKLKVDIELLINWVREMKERDQGEIIKVDDMQHLYDLDLKNCRFQEFGQAKIIVLLITKEEIIEELEESKVIKREATYYFKIK